ncbi:MAG TPA: protein kinase [Myxococcales bacterium]|nr:protein kinase [Myxococcales bacterium]
MAPERPTPEEAEIQVALAAGVLSADEARGLKEQARHQAQGPLQVLREQGRLSDETFASLARDARDVAAPERPAVEEEATLVRPSGEKPPAPSPWGATDAPPVTGWDRYHLLRLLGEGGMGRVYLAYDPRLQRNVALKFVKDGDRDLALRFSFEARAQARIDHPSVGKVYEVGEVQGKPFIAMQYVDGQPLHLAAPSLGLERKVLLLRDAARGVNEAHRVGIIHRDLKPSNLMVEQSGPDEPRLFVMDFGLARDWSASQTAAGSVLGTPQYMAPEQASGDVATLDRRVDVYALGATLYHVLCGEPPIPGSNALEVLRNVFTVEPRPLRQVAPDVPEDLQAIVMKCLEKNRSDRYDSARALADDLDRFLSGEPVQARAYGPYERARKFLRKNRRAATATGAAALALLLAVGWGVRLRVEAARRERFARTFTEKVERIEAGVRYSQLSPLHDTTADLRALGQRTAELEADVARGGESARGPGEYALGRGALALGDPRQALAHLQAAWDSGFREPRVAYALAVVNGQLYRDGLNAAERAGSKDVREAARRDLEKRYRDPALEFLRQSQGAEVPSPEYVSALVAFYEGRLDDALAHAGAIGDGLPWFFEAPLLKAQVLSVRAARFADSGDSRQAMESFDLARAAVAAATAIGESVPAVYLARAQLEYAALHAAIYGKGDVQGPYDRGLAAVVTARRADPRSVGAGVLEASLHRDLGEHLFSQGQDAEDLLARSERAAESARSLDPTSTEATLELIHTLARQALQRVNRGRDPRDVLDRALRLAEEASARGRNYALSMYLGDLHHSRAAYEAQIGVDPTPSRNRAIEAYEAATHLDDRATAAWSNLGNEYKERGIRPGAADPDGDLRRGAEALERARTLNPASWAICYHAATLRMAMADRTRARGDDPRPTLDEALRLYRAGSALNTAIPNIHNGIGQVLLAEAMDGWDRGEEPMPLVEEALKAFAQAVALAPGQGFGQANAGAAFTVRARYQAALGNDPSGSLAQAEAASREAVERLPKQAILWVNLAAVQVLRARQDLKAGKDPAPPLGAAQEALDTALKLNPKLARAWQTLGEARAVRGEWAAAHGRPFDPAFQEAAEAFERAAQIDPGDATIHLSTASGLRTWGLCRTRAGAEARPPLEQARAAAEAALRARPRWAEAMAVRAAILGALAPAAGGTPALEEARQQLAGALRVNPHLVPQWGSAIATTDR